MKLFELSFDDNAVAALNALKSSWKKLPPNWKGADPCNSSWVGVVCNNTRVTILYVNGLSIKLVHRVFKLFTAFLSLKFCVTISIAGN